MGLESSIFPKHSTETDFTGDSEGWELPNALRGRTVNWVPLPTSYVPVSISSAGLPGTNDYFLPP